MGGEEYSHSQIDAAHLSLSFAHCAQTTPRTVCGGIRTCWLPMGHCGLAGCSVGSGSDNPLPGVSGA